VDSSGRLGGFSRSCLGRSEKGREKGKGNRERGRGNREPEAGWWRRQCIQRFGCSAALVEVADVCDERRKRSFGGAGAGAESTGWLVAARCRAAGCGADGDGAVIALVHPVMLVSAHDEINGAVHIYAGYLAARNFVLAGMLLVLLIVGARRALGNLVAIVGLIQLVDAVMDVAEGRWAVAPGVFVFGVLFLFAAARFSGAAFWKLGAWK